jgi:uncharacterized protein YodC (DUF2158 family)
MADISIGEVVVLKSGGPRMTVELIKEGEPRILTCRWFDEDYRTADLPETVLKAEREALVKPKKKEKPKETVMLTEKKGLS